MLKLLSHGYVGLPIRWVPGYMTGMPWQVAAEHMQLHCSPCTYRFAVCCSGWRMPRMNAMRRWRQRSVSGGWPSCSVRSLLVRCSRSGFLFRAVPSDVWLAVGWPAAYERACRPQASILCQRKQGPAHESCR